MQCACRFRAAGGVLTPSCMRRSVHAQRHPLRIVLLVGRLKQRSQARVSGRAAFSGRAATPAKSHQPSPLRWSRELPLPTPLFPLTLPPTSSPGVWMPGPRWVSASKTVQEGSKTVLDRPRRRPRWRKIGQDGSRNGTLVSLEPGTKNTCPHAYLHVLMCDVKDDDGGSPDES